MKFPFLKRLFSQENTATATKVEAKNIPEQEVNDLIDSAINEVIVDDSPSSKKIDSFETVEKEHTRIIREAINPSVDFSIQKEIEGSTFEVDKINGISKITWNGAVSINAARQLVTMGADSVEFQGYKKLVLDRSNLLEFDTEARVWIKGMLKTRAKKIVRLVDQMAIIKPTTAKGSIFSNFIASAITIVMPNLEMQKFDNLDEAIEWLL